MLGKSPVMSNSQQALVALDGNRRRPRTHLYVAATLYSDGGSTPVRIRNMSPMGALIESPAIPETNSAVVLKRGALQAAGKIVWKVDRKAGVALLAEISVPDWMARQVNGQDRVDQIVSDFKSSIQIEPCSLSNAGGMPASISVVAQLIAVRSDLVRLGDSLACDSALVATHPDIQVLDICLQRLDRLIEHIDASGAP